MLSLRALLSSANGRRVAQVAIDACLVGLAYYLAFILRFDSGLPERYTNLLTSTFVFVVAGKVIVFAIFGLYHKLWRFVDEKDFQAIVKAVFASSLLLVGVLFLSFTSTMRPPRGVIALDFLLTLSVIGGSRFFVRLLSERPFRPTVSDKQSRKTLIVGAGNGGQQVASELERNPGLGHSPIGFIDDDPRKRGMRVAGLKVLGTTDELARVLDGAGPDEVVIAIPSAPGVLRQKVVTACRDRSIPVRTLPTVFELLSGGVNLMRQVREVQVEDVLGREPVRVELDSVGAYLSGRVVLVTGAGGSIGSELCRQIARVRPKLLVLVDSAESNLFEIRQELESGRHFHDSVAVLADCKDAVRMREVFLDQCPDVVFHAAAYKHVQLMEENPVEAVRNNAVASRIVAAAAGEAGVERFVFVSTDKAVNPQTVMGASKALAEWAIEAARHRFPGTRYSTVRFGNVLGSSGSVVQIFRRQIAAGGPVTVTDPAMSRYFMTIPEAVQLIIRSGDLYDFGAVYVLEMGDPVKIIDLASNMIRLSGQEPEKDIAIEVVGPRPGEKVHEALFNADERAEPTAADKIVAAVRDPLEPEWVEDAFARVESLVYNGDGKGLAETVCELATQRLPGDAQGGIGGSPQAAESASDGGPGWH
jgi:FlaA1/EpsC-like NDP-sugar epimerase